MINKILSPFEKNNKLSWTITLLIAINIFLISSISSITFPPSYGAGSSLKAVFYHFFAFFSLALSLSISMTKGKNEFMIFLALLISFLYGISDEIHQLFIPGRYFSLFDIMINSLGIVFACWVYHLSIIYREFCKNAKIL